ncbi:MAG TPA: hypothetical protein PKD91_02245 [Bacteroidia bacterium]|nr:hypothetical protein [Bacteroidia bacterium]
MAKDVNKQAGLKDGTKMYLEAASRPMPGVMGGNFLQLYDGPPGFKFSGYKFHIYATNKDEVVLILQCISEIVKEKGCIMKCATDQFFNNTRTADNPQHGKGVTIYLPFDMVNSGASLVFQQMLIDLLRNYETTGMINGDIQLGNSVFQRYEFNISWEEVKEMGGVSKEDYNTYYIQGT